MIETKIFSSHLNVLCKLYFDNDFYKQKIKAGISVPGWLVREENVIDETACSELTQVNCKTTD
jgi:hypothetical protein